MLKEDQVRKEKKKRLGGFFLSGQRKSTLNVILEDHSGARFPEECIKGTGEFQTKEAQGLKSWEVPPSWN